MLEKLYAMHTVYIYKSEVNILISMTLDLQSCKEDHNQGICYLSVLLLGKRKLGEACLRALLALNWFIVMVTVTWLGRYWNNIFIDNVTTFKSHKEEAWAFSLQALSEKYPLL